MSTNRRTQQARQRGAQQRAARQARRERAAELFAQGRSQVEVAGELDVSSRASAAGMPAGRPTAPRRCGAAAQLADLPRSLTSSWR
jgi:hypothetical protein